MYKKRFAGFTFKSYSESLSHVAVLYTFLRILLHKKTVFDKLFFIIFYSKYVV